MPNNKKDIIYSALIPFSVCNGIVKKKTNKVKNLKLYLQAYL